MLAPPDASSSGSTQWQHPHAESIARPLLYVTDGHYITPPPRCETDRNLWKLVIELYAYSGEEALRRAPVVTTAVPLASSGSGAAAQASSSSALAAARVCGEAVGSVARGEATVHGDLCVLITRVLHPIEATLIALQRRIHSAARQDGLLQRRQQPQPRSPSRHPLMAESWSSDDREHHKASGSVFDLALQHPFPPLRRALVECLLNYLDVFCFANCAPFAVCAAVGDVAALRLLLVHGGDAMDPNCGFPLTVAVQHNQLGILRELLSATRADGSSGGARDGAQAKDRHHAMSSYASASSAMGATLARLKPNYGNPFAEAVRTGNVAAAAILAGHDGVNINRFANNRGTNPLLCACRAFIEAARAVTAVETALQQRGWRHGGDAAPGVGETEERERSASSAAASSPHNHHKPGSHPLPVRRKVLSPKPSGVFSNNTPRHAAVGSGSSASGGGQGCFFRQQRAAALAQLNNWREMVCLLLSLPAVDPNMGYYTSPLQLAAHHNCPELVELLLLHPRVRPSRVPKPTTALAESSFSLKHDTLSQAALKHAVSPAVELALSNNSVEVFLLLARHPKTAIHVALLEALERDPRDLSRVPFLSILAQHRRAPREREGWGWKWRRRCVYGAALAGLSLCVLNSLLMFALRQHASSLVWFLLLVYAVGFAPTAFWAAFRRYRVPEALAATLSRVDGSEEVGAAVASRLRRLPLTSPGAVEGSSHTSELGSGDGGGCGGADGGGGGGQGSLAVMLTPSHRAYASVSNGSPTAATASNAPSQGSSLTLAASQQQQQQRCAGVLSPPRSCGVGPALVRVVLSTSHVGRRCCCCFLWRCCGRTGAAAAKGASGARADEASAAGDGGLSGEKGGPVVGRAAAALLATLLLAVPIVPLLELVVLWALTGYATGNTASSGRVHRGRDGGGGGGTSGPILDSPEALTRFLRRTFSPTHLGLTGGGQAERVVLVNDSDVDDELGGESDRATPGVVAQSYADDSEEDEERDAAAAHEALVEEAGRKVFLHDGDGIGDTFSFHQRQIQQQRARQPQPPPQQRQQHRPTATAAAGPGSTVVVVGGGVGSEKLRRSPPVSVRGVPSASLTNESFSYPRPAAASTAASARRRLADEAPLPAAASSASPHVGAVLPAAHSRGNPRRDDGKASAPSTAMATAAAISGPARSPAVSAPALAQGQRHEQRAFYSTAYLWACVDACPAGVGQGLLSDGRLVCDPSLYVRSLAYLCLEVVAPARLLVALVSLFTHLLTLFPESSTDSGTVNEAAASKMVSTGAAVVAALGLLASVAVIAVYMTMLLALRRTAPESLLSGQRSFYDEDSTQGPLEEYLL